MNLDTYLKDLFQVETRKKIYSISGILSAMLTLVMGSVVVTDAVNEQLAQWPLAFGLFSAAVTFVTWLATSHTGTTEADKDL